MRLESNPSKFGVKRNKTRFMRIFIVQTAQSGKTEYGFNTWEIRFPSNLWYLNWKVLWSVHQSTGEVW